MADRLVPLLEGARLDHLSMVVHDRDRTMAAYRRIAAGPFRTVVYRNTARIYGERSTYTLRMALAPLASQVDLEIIELAGGAHAIHETFLAARGEGVQHIGYEVEDFEGAIDAFRSAGYPLILEKDGPGGVSAYMDTAAAGGTITELIRKGFKLASLMDPAP